MTTWFIADTHLGHKNIARLCNRPDNHEELIQENWKALVKEDDVVIHLGDVAFKNRVDVKRILDELPGRKMLTKGNHDSHGNAKYLALGFEVVARKAMVVEETDKYVLVASHKPLKAEELAEFDKPNKHTINLHGHIHNSVSEVFTPPTYINLCVEVTDYKPVSLDSILEVLDGSVFEVPGVREISDGEETHPVS